VELHRRLAVELNQLVWRLLEKPERSVEEDDTMLHAAHASAYHWQPVPANVPARGHWLIARVHVMLNQSQPALYHARRSLELCEDRACEDFDWAYAYEGMARANAAGGQTEEAREFRRRAREAGEAIRGEEDRNLFFSDLDAEPWFGV
jgi:hypothetical protein